MIAVTFYNVIDEMPDPYDRTLARMHGDRFEKAIAHCRERLEIVPFDEAMSRLNAGEDTSRTLTITFDNGFAGVYAVARPILSALGLVGTVFIMTAQGDSAAPDQLMEFERLEIGLRQTSVKTVELPWLGLGRLDIDGIHAKVLGLRLIKQKLKRLRATARQEALGRVLAALCVSDEAIALYAQNDPRFCKLSSAQVKGLRAEGWTIGGNTRTHASLRGLDESALRYEVEGSAEDLAVGFGLRHAPFAYPYGTPGDIDQQVRNAVQAAGFSAAFTSTPGHNGHSTDLYELSRFDDVDSL